jgi:glycosyltransferase involved in cell wall biosynthesis
MACGTPVVTTNWGAAPEVVLDGVTGFRRDTDDDLVQAVAATRSLAPAACRAWVEEQFSGSAMVAGYTKVYEQVLASR